MPELTDSFCERCGTRYAFVGSAPKALSIKGARVLAKGLKNFVLTDGQSIADAMDLARQEDGHEVSTLITEAFHRTFNFCMSCRQYACEKCWNASAGACLSCSPAPEAEAETGYAPQLQPAREGYAAGEPVPSLQSAAAPSDWSLDGLETNPSPAPAPEGTAPVAWPAVDLAEPHATPAASSNGRNGHAQTPADLEAAALWPIADSIAPELTLTPEEMELVQAHLDQIQAISQTSSPAEAPADEAPLLSDRAAWWHTGPDDGPDRSAEEWTLSGQPAASQAQPEPAGAAAQYDGGVASPPPESVPAPAATTGDEFLQTEVTRPAPHILHLATSPGLPPLASTAPEPEREGPTGLVARLLGRRAADGDAPATAAPRHASVHKGQPGADPWPQPTLWAKRSIEGPHWSRGVYAAAEDQASAAGATELAFEQAAGEVAPIAELAPAPASQRVAATSSTGSSAIVPEPAESSTADIDPRSAAALRLSAVEASASYEGPTEPRPADIGEEFGECRPPRGPAPRRHADRGVGPSPHRR